MKSKALLLLFTFLASVLTVTAQEDLKKYISAECNTLIGIDMKSLLNIPALNEFMQSADSEEMKQMSELGLRPQDVDSVLIGLDSQALANDPLAFEKQPEMISISNVKEGITFEKLIEAAKKNKVETEDQEIDGLKTVILNKDKKQFVMTQLSKGVIALGSMNMVKKTISLKNGKTSENILGNDELSKLASAQKGLFWLVGAKPKADLKSAADAPLDNPMNSVFGDLKMFTVSFAFNGKEIQLNSDLICNNKEGADKLAFTAQFLTAGLAMSDNSPVKSDQIKFTKNESTLNVKVNIDSASLIKTLEAAKGLAQE